MTADARDALQGVVRGLSGAWLDRRRAFRLGLAVRDTGRRVAALRDAQDAANDPAARDRLAVDLQLAAEAHAAAFKALADEIQTCRGFAERQADRLTEALAAVAGGGPLRGSTHVLALGQGRWRLVVTDMGAALGSVPAELWHDPPPPPEPRLRVAETLKRLEAGERFAGVARERGKPAVSVTMADAFDRRKARKG